MPGSSLYKTLDSELEKELYAFQNEAYKVVPLVGYVEAYQGHTLKFYLSDEMDHHVMVESDVYLEKAQSKPADKEQIAQQFSKFGGTPFYIKHLEVFTDEDVFISIKLMNELRRKALEEIERLRIFRDEAVIIFDDVTSNEVFQEEEKLIVKVHTKDQLQAAIDLGIKEIYYDDILSVKHVKSDVLLIPARKRIVEEDPYPIDQMTVISETGALFVNQNKHDLITDEFVNVTNVYTAALLSHHNVKRITLSAELDKSHVLDFAKRYKQTFG